MKKLACRAVLLMGCVVAIPTTAHADEQNAEQMFQLGLSAMKKKDYTTACEAFGKSNRADPSPGTQMNLALCFEKKKQWASAWTWYRSAVGLAQQKGQREREQLAEDSANRVLPQVHYVIIATKEPLTDLSVKRDGIEVTTTLNNKDVPVPVDPGTHTFEVAAKNKKPWSTTITAADDTKTDRIEVPVLEDVSVASAPVALPATHVDDRTPVVPHDGNNQRTAGIIVGSAGVLSGLAAVGMFVLANHQADKRDANKALLAKHDTTDITDYRKGASDYANATDNDRLIGYILTGGAVVLVGVGTVLYFTALKASSKVGDTRILPLLTPNFAGLGASGSF